LRGKRRQHPIFEKVEILDIVAEGKALARVNELVLFVTGTVPGDVVDVKISRKQKNFMEGVPVKFHTYSTLRIEPFCSHFGVCGGCKWQNLPYAEQLKFKQQQVVDALKHIAKIDLPAVKNIIASEETEYYRNKLEYAFSNRRWLTGDEIDTNTEYKNMNALGFHVPKLFDKIVDIKKCYLQKEPSNKIRLAVKQYALENELTFHDVKSHKGFLRNLTVRTSETEELMVIVTFFYDEPTKRNDLLQFIADSFPEITSLLYVINSKLNDTIFDLDIQTYKGRDYILENLADMKFKIGGKSFFQTNTKQATKLYELVREFADFKGDEIVYDLYTGTGTIANFVAPLAKKVIGIETISEAIADAQENSKLNNISNTTFYTGDIKDVLLPAFMEENGLPNVIITDPPRAGMHKDVVNTILKIEAQTIVYVSCNPATQARDLALFDEKYKVMEIQPVDMFPHTHHVENVVLLKKKNIENL